MAITEEQRQTRTGYLGSSDMAAVLGVDPWRNAYDVWLQKTGRVEAIKETEVMEAGTLFEDGVLDWAEKQLGPLKRNTKKDPLELELEGFPIIDHPDALTQQTGEPLESKTTGLFGPTQEAWGPANTGDVPYRVIVQCHVHMLCANTEICHVPVFIGGRGFQMYQVPYDQVIAEAIMDISVEFWEDVENDYPPGNIVPSVAFVKRIKREPEKIVDLDPKLAEDLNDAKEKVKWAEAVKDEAYAAVLLALGDAEAGKLPNGSMMTFFEQVSNRIDAKRLREEQPKIAAEYTKESRCRVLRLKKPQKKKYL